MVDVNFDTSVLVDYLTLALDDRLGVERLARPVSSPEKTADLLENDENRRVIGNKVDQEFEALCDRHHEIYTDMVGWASENQDESLVNYDPTSREVHVSNNDVDFVRFRILVEWDDEGREKQLSDFRRLKQDVRTVEEGIRGYLDATYQRDDSETDLSDALDDLNLGHDKEVAIDAVVIAQKSGINLLTSTDSDLTDNEEEINARLREENRNVSLEILKPSEV